MVCQRKLRAWELIPIVSFFLLRGKCSGCGAQFSGRYPLVEALTAVVFLWTYQTVGLGPELIKGWLFAAFLILITFIDLDHQLIYDTVLLWLGGVGILCAALSHYWNDLLAVFGSQLQAVVLLPSALDLGLGFLLGGGLMLILALASNGGMGGGDIKFAAAFGVWLGWKFTLLALLLSFLLGGTISALLLVAGIKGRKDMIPFGPFLALGAWISFLYGGEILRWYLGTW